jgi:hypothetical protein
MLLTLSDVERGIYDNCISDLEKRQLCCHLQVVRRLQEVVGPQLMTPNRLVTTHLALRRIMIILNWPLLIDNVAKELSVFPV